MTQLIAFFRELVLRLQHESPALFKKLQWITGLIAMIIGLLLGGNEMFNWGWGLIELFNIPLTQILFAIVSLLTGAFGASKLPVSDKKELDERMDNSKIEP